MQAWTWKAGRYRVAYGVAFTLASLVCHQSRPTLAIAAESAEEHVRAEAWQKALEQRDFVAPDEKSLLSDSLRALSDGSVRLSYDSKRRGQVTYAFSYMGKDTVTLQGHLQSSFATHNKRLYFAQYPTSSTGCTVLAFDLESGKKLWEVSLHHQKPHEHSSYSNVVSLRLTASGAIANAGGAGAAVIISGSESYCDYVEVLDSATGKPLRPEKGSELFVGTGKGVRTEWHFRNW